VRHKGRRRRRRRRFPLTDTPRRARV